MALCVDCGGQLQYLLSSSPSLAPTGPAWSLETPKPQGKCTVCILCLCSELVVLPYTLLLQFLEKLGLPTVQYFIHSHSLYVDNFFLRIRFLRNIFLDISISTRYTKLRIFTKVTKLSHRICLYCGIIIEYKHFGGV